MTTTRRAGPEPVEEVARKFFMDDQELYADPYPVYERLRSECPVGRSEMYGGYWILSKYDDIQFACQRPEIFSSNPAHIPPSMGQERPLIPLEIDPPDHGRYRQILAPLFAPPRMRSLENQIRAAVNRLIDGFIERGSCEFIADFAEPLPTQTFLRLMGWPEEHAAQFLAWKNVIIHGVPGDPDASEAARVEAGTALYTYFAEVLDERSESPGDDVMSVLLAADFDGERSLSQFEVLDIVFLLLIAGLDTITGALGNAFVHLAQHPANRDRIVGDPSCIPTAVEELLRYESPIATGRRVLADVTVGGTQFRAGDTVLLLFGSGSRDDDEFPGPAAVDFDRHPNRHLGFGAGPHRCVGSHLARLELQIAFEEFHRRIPDYRLAAGTVPARQLTQVRVTNQLDLEFSPGRRLEPAVHQPDPRRTIP